MAFESLGRIDPTNFEIEKELSDQLEQGSQGEVIVRQKTCHDSIHAW